MTEERKGEIYAALVQEAEAHQKIHGEPATRWKALNWLANWHDRVDLDSIDLVEKLYSDGFVSE